MTLKEYREKINPCYGCGAYDEDYGCSMPSTDLPYACPIYIPDENEEWE